jgi:hypothetical protein
MSVRTLRVLSIHLVRHWLLTLIISILAVFAASYFYFTTTHALESFDTGSCIPLTLDSSGQCVSSLQELLNADQAYPPIAVDGSFGPETMQAVIRFQSVHRLTMDGVVAEETADAINESSPRPSILSYAAGFANSRLAPSAKLCVAALMAAATIACLLLRAAYAGSSRRLVIRCALAGLFAALIAVNSIAAQSLLAKAHGWIDTSLSVILIALSAALFKLFSEMSGVPAFSAFADPPPPEIQSPAEARYGS